MAIARATTTLRLLVPLFAMACQSPPAADVRLDAPGGDGARAFPAPQHLLQGFDAAQADGDWRVGDEVLFGLRLLRDGEVRHWLLHVRLTEPLARSSDASPLPPVDWSIRINGEPQQFASRPCRVVATVMDEHGVELGRSEPILPRDFLARGIAGACRLVHEHLSGAGVLERRRRYRRIDVRPLAEGTVSAVALLQVVQQDDVLAPLLWQVVSGPSLWSVLRNLGARVVLRPRFHELAEVPSPVAAVRGSAFVLPLTLSVNDEAALAVDLFVAAAAPPFALCGGVLGATARHPTDPGLALSIRLLSARRGPAQRSSANGREIALDSR